MLESLRRLGRELAPVPIRILLAIVFMYHGYGKVFEGGAAGLASALHIPLALGWAAAITEFFGGLFILIGLLTRFWAMGLVITMIVAIAAVHGANGFDLLQQGFAWRQPKEVRVDSVTVKLPSPLEARPSREAAGGVEIVGGPKIGYEYNVVLLLAALSLVLGGAGRFSIDHAIGCGLGRNGLDPASLRDRDRA